MTPNTIDWSLPLDLCGINHTIVITGVPIMRCQCGIESYNIDIGIRVDELIDRIVLDALRYQKKVPDVLTIEELFKVI